MKLRLKEEKPIYITDSINRCTSNNLLLLDADKLKGEMIYEKIYQSVRHRSFNSLL